MTDTERTRTMTTGTNAAADEPAFRVWIDSRQRGDERTVTATIRGTEWDITQLIDQLDLLRTGPGAVLGAAIARATGLVAADASADTQMARMLRHYADQLEARKAS